MKANLLEVVASQIASQILKEDFKITDEESRQDALAKQIDKDDLRASEKAETEELTDEGDEEGDDDKDEKEIEAKPKPDAEDEDKGEEDFEVQAPDVIPDLISYGQIEKQINNLRAGKSLKDEEISSALEDYFSALGTGEQGALFAYLASIGAILTGGTSGEDAPRPSQMGIKIVDKEKKEKLP